MFKAIIFDLDGTLVDSPLSLDAIREELGLPDKTPILESIENLPVSERDQAEVVIRKHERAAAEEAHLISGVESVLQRLQESSISVGVLTRNCRPATDRVIERLALSFDGVVTRDCAPSKPNPAGLLKLLDQWGVLPGDGLYVGDYLFDIQTGRNAQVATALYAPDSLPKYADLADFVFSDFADFLDRVGQIEKPTD